MENEVTSCSFYKAVSSRSGYNLDRYLSREGGGTHNEITEDRISEKHDDDLIETRC